MKVTFHPEALTELEGAALFYGQQREGLGGRFVAAVESAILGIQESPERWPIFEQDVRRRLVRVFPYVILYDIEPKSILVIAVMHTHQKPFYWRSRASN
jgi:plasmid stabilization system protein ParE